MRTASSSAAPVGERTATGSLMERADEPQRLARAVLALEGRRSLGLPVGARNGERADHEADGEIPPEAHAATGAQRGARRSWIGRCTTAAARPSAIEIHHIASYAPVAS